MIHVISTFVVSLVPISFVNPLKISRPQKWTWYTPNLLPIMDFSISYLLKIPEMKPYKDTSDSDMGSKAPRSACPGEISPLQDSSSAASSGNRSPCVIKLRILSLFLLCQILCLLCAQTFLFDLFFFILDLFSSFGVTTPPPVACCEWVQKRKTVLWDIICLKLSLFFPHFN